MHHLVSAIVMSLISFAVLAQDGCTYEVACNYDPEAVVNDGSCDFTSCLGCTNWNASNYDPTALIDDGSCDIDCDSLCQSDFNDDLIVNTDDLLMILSQMGIFCSGFQGEDQLNTLPVPDAEESDTSSAGDVLGCMVIMACNYNPDATLEDGSCDFQCLMGCTTCWAFNYSSTATIDDGSCIFEDPCPTDLDDDGWTDVGDLLIFLTEYGNPCY